MLTRTTSITQGPTKKRKRQSIPIGPPLKRIKLFNNADVVRTSTVETKYIDTPITFISSAGPTSQITVLNAVGQGNDNNNRIGRKITVKSVTLRLIASVLAAGTVGDTFRIMCFYDNATVGANPPALNVLQEDSATGLMNIQNSDRFHVISDNYLDVGNAGPQTASLKRHIKFRCDTKYTGTGGGVTTIGTGGIFLYIQDIAANLDYLVNGWCRVKFTDE